MNKQWIVGRAMSVPSEDLALKMASKVLTYRRRISDLVVRTRAEDRRQRDILEALKLSKRGA